MHPGRKRSRKSRRATNDSRLVYQSLPNANTQLQLYATWEQAVNDLLEGLARMQALLEKPKDV